MNSSPAYLLIFHGSRDPRPQQAAQSLAFLMAKELSHSALVEVAALELSQFPLHQQIIKLAQQSQTIKIIPLFLLAGVHVSEDIPQEVEQARMALPSSVTLEMRPYLGSYSALVSLLATQLDPAIDGGILLAHGSRRPQSHAKAEEFATQLGLLNAYWSVEPSLGIQIEKLINLGKKHLVILPYFLFSGGITDAIAEQIPILQSQFSQVKLSLGQPLGATPHLAKIILEETHAIG